MRFRAVITAGTSVCARSPQGTRPQGAARMPETIRADQTEHSAPKERYAFLLQFDIKILTLNLPVIFSLRPPLAATSL